MAARSNTLAKRVDVTRPVLRSHEEMKHGPVVPQRIASRGTKGGHILMYESNRGSGRPQAMVQPLESSRRDVEDGQVPVSCGEQLVHEEGSPGTDIYYGVCRSKSG